MTNDREIRTAIQAGERNREVMELVRNWCVHARVEKFGGVGLIEAETGLPIGHHGLACDHAPAGGMATWDLADAALDFHDRNCVDCVHRVPRGLPNLSKLVEQRCKARAERKRRQELYQEEQRQAFLDRQAVRNELRQSLPPISQDVIDQLEELDRNSTSDNQEKLIHTAKLAPEVFADPIVDYMFTLVEAGEYWFIDTGLRLLSMLNADAPRLTRCSMAALAAGPVAAEIAGEVVVRHTSLIDASQIEAALRSLVGLANPRRSPVYSAHPVRIIETPLLTLYQSYSDSVRSAIEAHIDRREPHLVSVAARAILVIHSVDESISEPFCRTVVALLCRAETMLDFPDHVDRNDQHELYSHLQDILSFALTVRPEETDDLVASFIATARSEAQVRLIRAYRDLFSTSFRQRELEECPAHSIALRRLLNMAESANESELLFDLVHTFRDWVPDGLEGLIRREMNHLLGAAALLDERRAAFSEEVSKATNTLEAMERNNLRSAVLQVQEGLVKWVASAAAGSVEHSRAYVQILDGIPEAQDQFRGIMVSAISRLMTTSEGLNIALPSLYTSLVGASQILRAAAVEALGKLDGQRQEDLPSLVYEAFLLALTDSFVIVHRAALRTLRESRVPEEFADDVRLRVLNLILTYSHSKDADDFLIECISIYVTRYAKADELSGDIGALIVDQMARMDSWFVSREIGWLGKKLVSAPGFAAMAIDLLAPTLTDRIEEGVVRILREIPPSALYEERSRLQNLAMENLDDRDTVAVTVELLTEAGAWAEAEIVGASSVANIPDTTHNRPRRLFMDLLRIATSYESAVAGGSIEKLDALERQWSSTLHDIEQNRIENEKRRSFIPDLPGAS